MKCFGAFNRSGKTVIKFIFSKTKKATLNAAL